MSAGLGIVIAIIIISLAFLIYLYFSLINDVQAQLETAQKDLAAKILALSVATQQQSDLQAKIRTAEEDIKKLSGSSLAVALQIKPLDDEITRINDEITKINADIADLTKQYTQQQTLIQNIKPRYSVVESNINPLLKNLQIITADELKIRTIDYVDAKSSLDELESDIKTTGQQIITLQNTKDKIISDNKPLDDNILTAQTALDTEQKTSQTLLSNINSLNITKENLMKTISDLQKRKTSLLDPNSPNSATYLEAATALAVKKSQQLSNELIKVNAWLKQYATGVLPLQAAQLLEARQKYCTVFEGDNEGTASTYNRATCLLNGRVRDAVSLLNSSAQTFLDALFAYYTINKSNDQVIILSGVKDALLALFTNSAELAKKKIADMVGIENRSDGLALGTIMTSVSDDDIKNACDIFNAKANSFKLKKLDDTMKNFIPTDKNDLAQLNTYFVDKIKLQSHGLSFNDLKKETVLGTEWKNNKPVPLDYAIYHATGRGLIDMDNNTYEIGSDGNATSSALSDDSYAPFTFNEMVHVTYLIEECINLLITGMSYGCRVLAGDPTTGTSPDPFKAKEIILGNFNLINKIFDRHKKGIMLSVMSMVDSTLIGAGSDDLIFNINVDDTTLSINVNGKPALGYVELSLTTIRQKVTDGGRIELKNIGTGNGYVGVSWYVKVLRDTGEDIKVGDVIEIVVKNTGGAGGLSARWSYLGKVYYTSRDGTNDGGLYISKQTDLSNNPLSTVSSDTTYVNKSYDSRNKFLAIDHPWDRARDEFGNTEGGTKRKLTNGQQEWIWSKDACTSCINTFTWIAH